MGSTTIPDAVQTSYTRTLADGLPGTIADQNPGFDRSFVGETAAGIPFGAVISQGENPQGAVLGSSTLAAAAGYAVGTGAVDSNVADYTSISAASFSVKIDGTTVNVSALSLTGVTSMATLASTIQTALRSAAQTAVVTGYASITVTYDASANQFTITSGTTGASSSVTFIANYSTGTAIAAMLGFSSYAAIAGTAQVAASPLGVVIRSVTEAGGFTATNVTSIAQGHVGAYRADGAIKVLINEATTQHAQVWFNKTTGLIYASSNAGACTTLGTAKFQGAYSIGTVGKIDITGLR